MVGNNSVVGGSVRTLINLNRQIGVQLAIQMCVGIELYD